MGQPSTGHGDREVLDATVGDAATISQATCSTIVSVACDDAATAQYPYLGVDSAQ